MNVRTLLGQSGNAQKIQLSQLLTEEGQTYFNQVLTEYQLLPHSATPSSEEVELRKVADGIAGKQAEARTWGDLFALEIIVVKLEGVDRLRRSAWAIRAKFKDLAGDKAWDAYQASSPPDPKTGNEDELRSDTLRILEEFHWIYAFAPLREKLRSRLIKLVFAITTVCLVLVLGMAAYAYWVFDGHGSNPATRVNIPILSVVVAMGLMGGFVSLQQRIQGVPSTGDPIVNIAELSNSQFSFYLAPLSGAIFAVILYIIFIGGLLTGPLFPKMSSPPAKCAQTTTGPTSTESAPQGTASAGSTGGENSNHGSAPGDASKPAQKDSKPCLENIEFSEFLKQTGPQSGADFAMLLLWAFIAGFAERFVPDTIDRLVSQAAKK